MIGIRHILVYGYFDVDLDIVWSAAQVNLVRLKEQIAAILHCKGNSEKSLPRDFFF